MKKISSSRRRASRPTPQPACWCGKTPGPHGSRRRCATQTGAWSRTSAFPMTLSSTPLTSSRLAYSTERKDRQMNRRRGPGLIRTAAVVGTATVVSKGVSSSMDQRAAQQQAAQQQQQQAAYDAGAQAAQMQAQQAAAAQAAPAPAAGPGAVTNESIAQLQQLAELQKQGILTPEEFAQQKAKLLGM